MEEDKLHRLFDQYNPTLSADCDFMKRLEHNLEAVELVKQRVELMHRKNRMAVIVAAITGFVFGLLSTFCYPYLTVWLNSLTFEAADMARFVADYGNVAVWGIISLMVGVVTYCAYDITLIATRKFALSAPQHRLM